MSMSSRPATAADKMGFGKTSMNFGGTPAGQPQPSLDQASQFNSSLNPQGLSSNYQNALDNSPASSNTFTNQQSNTQIPIQTQQVQAQVPDYGPMVQSMQQYVQSMQQLLDQINQR